MQLNVNPWPTETRALKRQSPRRIGLRSSPLVQPWLGVVHDAKKADNEWTQTWGFLFCNLQKASLPLCPSFQLGAHPDRHG